MTVVTEYQAFIPCLVCGDRFLRLHEAYPDSPLALVCCECLAAGEVGGEAALTARHGGVKADYLMLGQALRRAEKR